MCLGAERNERGGAPLTRIGRLVQITRMRPPNVISALRHVLVLLLACALPALAQRGPLYIVGGGPQTEAMVREFVELAGGAGRAHIVVLAMASASGERSGEAKANDLRTLGATARNVWVTREQADLDSVARLLAQATGIWFGGGDQNRLADIVRGTALERAIAARHAAGAVVGGTSAGAAVLSSVMITGDERRRGGSRPGSDSSAVNITIDRDNVVTSAGFALLNNAVIDQHFVRRRRHNRLISLVLEQAPHLGAGIDESTALVVAPDGSWRVSGESVVVIYDAREAARSGASAPVLGAAGMRMHVLPAGARFVPATGVASMP
jgi:cyanophycinase